MKRLLFSSWLLHSFPPVKGAGFRCHVRWTTAAPQLLSGLRSSLSDCKQARPAGALSIKTGATLYPCPMPRPHPPASHLPARTAEIRLKSTLQGPKGARVLKQVGSPGIVRGKGCKRETEFWAVGPTWWRALEHGISLSIQKETQKNL